MKTTPLRFIQSLVVSVSLCAASSVLAQDAVTEESAGSIAAADAKQHIGETNTVCGTVADAVYLSESQSKLTFLNFELPHPNQVFDVVIEEASRANFTEPPEEFYKGKKICVTGAIEQYRDRAQIKVSDPKQITVIPATP